MFCGFVVPTFFVILIGVGQSFMFVVLLSSYIAERELHRVIHYRCFLCYRYSSSHSIAQGAKQVDSSLVC